MTLGLLRLRQVRPLERQGEGLHATQQGLAVRPDDDLVAVRLHPLPVEGEERGQGEPVLRERLAAGDEEGRRRRRVQRHVADVVGLERFELPPRAPAEPGVADGGRTAVARACGHRHGNRGADAEDVVVPRAAARDERAAAEVGELDGRELPAQKGPHAAMHRTVQIGAVGHQPERAGARAPHHLDRPAHETHVGVREDADLPLAQRFAIRLPAKVLEEPVAQRPLAGALRPAADPRRVPDHEHRPLDLRQSGQRVAHLQPRRSPQRRLGGAHGLRVPIDAHQGPSSPERDRRGEEGAGAHRGVHDRQGRVVKAREPERSKARVRAPQHEATDRRGGVHHPMAPAILGAQPGVAGAGGARRPSFGVGALFLGRGSHRRDHSPWGEWEGSLGVAGPAVPVSSRRSDGIERSHALAGAVAGRAGDGARVCDMRPRAVRDNRARSAGRL